MNCRHYFRIVSQNLGMSTLLKAITNNSHSLFYLHIQVNALYATFIYTKCIDKKRGHKISV
jgi:hypothetical protein